MLKIYLDLYVYNRPFDNQRQPRIMIETIAFLVLLSKAIDREITIVYSFILEDENSKNPFINRRDKIYDFLKVGTEYVGYSEELERRAKEIEKFGVMARMHYISHVLKWQMLIFW